MSRRPLSCELRPTALQARSPRGFRGFGLALCLANAAAGSATAAPVVNSIEEVALTVSDADRAVSFYTEVLTRNPCSPLA